MFEYMQIRVIRPDEAMCELEGRSSNERGLYRQLVLTYADTLGTILMINLTLTLMRMRE